MNRTDRLVAIVLLLHAKKVVRARDIAERFGIALRTVYRDMKALNEAGVPIAAEAGEGYSLVEGYHLPPVMFTQDEANALYLGGEMVKMLTDESLRYPAESGVAKILAILPEHQRDYLYRLGESTAMMPRGSRGGFTGDVLRRIQEAVVGRHVVVIEYNTPRREGRTTREIEPLALVWFVDHWHCIAYCRLRKDYRDFRTDRLRILRVLDQTFPVRPDFSLKTFVENYVKIENPQEIRVRFQKSAAAFVRDRYSFGVVHEKELDGRVEMTILVPSLEVVKAWLLSFGDSVEVLEPKELIALLAEEATRLRAHYERSLLGR